MGTQTARQDVTPSSLTLQGGWLEFLWFIVILSLSFNLYGPGRPQPGDFMLVGILCLPILILRFQMPASVSRPVFWLGALVAYIAFCNALWASSSGELDFFKSTAFYAFNFCVFLGYLVMLGERGDDWLRWTLYGFAATLIVLALLSIPFGHRNQSGRLQLFFVNPNQLAYHVLLSASIVAMLAPRFRVSRPILYGLLLLAFYLELRTYSRAGLLGIALLGALQLVHRPTLLTIFLFPVLIFALYLDLQALDSDLWQNRLETVQTGDTGEYMTDRGLDRIVDHPEHLFFGAGEGFYLRFHHSKFEIHSSAANLLFSYGIVGTGLFLMFLRKVSVVAGARLTLIMIPALSYSLFHNGMRARPFWLLLAVALGLGAITIAESLRANSPSPSRLGER